MPEKLQSATRVDPLVAKMIRDAIPVTRDNYIDLNWGKLDEPWTAEHESQLPEQLQDWSKFKLINGEYVYQDDADANGQ